MELKPFQKEALEKAVQFLKSRRAVYNACEPGLGKTIQTIELMNRFQATSALIVCPVSMLFTWKKELEIWWKGYKFPILVVRSSKDIPEVKNYNFVIVSYNLVTSYVEVFERKKYEFLILDEAHKVKSKDTQRTKACLGRLWNRCHYKAALSGTPFTNCVTDGFTLFNRMAPELFPNYHQFANRYSYAVHSQWGTKYEGVRNHEELNALIKKHFYIRYRKDEVLHELPEKNFIRITLPDDYRYKLPSGDKEKFEASVNAMLQLLERDAKIPVLPEHMAGERRFQGRLKVKPITNYVEDMLEEGRPVILFAYHRDVIADFCKSLERHAPAVITGDVSAKARELAKNDFQEGRTNLFIGQIVAAGTGITLTRSSDVVLAEMTWTPAEISQAVDRAHRIGQEKIVNVHYFVVDGSLDESIIETVVRKARDFRKVTDGKDERKIA